MKNNTINRHNKSIVGNAALIKSINKKSVLDYIMKNGIVSKADVSVYTNLALPTVIRIVDELVKDCVVEEIGKGVSTGGRRPVLICLNSDKYYFVGSYIQTKMVKSVVTDINGVIRGSCEMKLSYSESKEKILTKIAECVMVAIKESGVGIDKIACMCIGTPGMDFKYYEENLNKAFGFWASMNRELFSLKNHLKFPIINENIAKLGAIAELKFGFGKYMQNYLYIYVDDGIGMVAVTNSKLDRGYSGNSGELGHTTINFDGLECYCGNKGCLEMYCAERALVSAFAVELFNEGKSTIRHNICLSDLIDAVNANDKTALRIIEKNAIILGKAVANVANLYNPQAVAFGGGLHAKLPLYFEIAKKEALKNIFAYPAKKLEFIADNISEDLVLGAAALAIEALCEKICNSD